MPLAPDNLPPDLADAPALARNRARALRASEMFLHDAAADEVKERLKQVNRSFTNAAIVAPFSAPWSDLGPVMPDSDPLEFRTDQHDLIVHALALHWASDPVGQLIQCRRASKPDGFFLAVLFGGRTLFELRAVLAEAEVEVTGGLSPRVAPMGDIRDLGALLQRAQFALPVADSQTIRVEYRNLHHLAYDLRGMGETNALAGRLRHATKRSVFQRAEDIYQRVYPGRNGGIMATFELIYLSGWAPGPDQPRALRPGSATNSLAQALGTVEIKATDT